MRACSGLAGDRAWRMVTTGVLHAEVLDLFLVDSLKTSIGQSNRDLLARIGIGEGLVHVLVVESVGG